VAADGPGILPAIAAHAGRGPDDPQGTHRPISVRHRVRKANSFGSLTRAAGRSKARYLGGRTVVRFETRLKKRNTFSICGAPRRIQNS
jgi:hypothetical protein